jgi:UDP-N-acetylbacillosamine N-acetyltransferase
MMSPDTGLLILGFGGHARSVADVAIASGITQLCFIDANAKPNESFC